jgi:DNA-directed RNA polymerase specialized sigma24 family protein
LARSYDHFHQLQKENVEREDFAQRYYRPVIDFLLVLVQDREQAQVLAQDFFARLSRPDGILHRATPEKGAFRDYLQQSLRHLAIDHHRHGRKAALETHPDQHSSRWEALSLGRYPEAEAAFHRAWIKATLAEALTLVRAACLNNRQDLHLDLFSARYLSEAEPEPSWEELGARYGLDEKAARKRADTVARHFRVVLRRMLRNEITVPEDSSSLMSEAAIDEEIRALLSPLGD